MINFFTSPIGLGHATRDIAIAEKLDRQALTFVTGGPAAELLQRKGLKALDVYRPARFEVESGELKRPLRWLLGYYSYYKRCKEIARDHLSKEDGPVVSDEDFASVAVGEELGRRRALITDIEETSFTAGPASVIEKAMNRSMKKMMGACDCVIIPDTGDDSGNVVHVGPMVREASAGREDLRKSFGLSKKTIVLSIGGTDAGKFLIEKAIEAFRRVGPRLDAELVIVSGPSHRVADSADYRSLGFVENLHELIFASDLVISLAGRSTMDESVAYGTPGIFIPIKGHFEQERGAARLGFSFDDIYRLDQLVEEKLSSGRQSSAGTGGAARAAKIISSL